MCHPNRGEGIDTRVYRDLNNHCLHAGRSAALFLEWPASHNQQTERLKDKGCGKILPHKKLVFTNWRKLHFTAVAVSTIRDSAMVL
jgi:hypothetical protein